MSICISPPASSAANQSHTQDFLPQVSRLTSSCKHGGGHHAVGLVQQAVYMEYIVQTGKWELDQSKLKIKDCWHLG